MTNPHPSWLLLDTKRPLVYRKHVLSVGQFSKDGTKFEITPTIIQHLASATQTLLSDGVAVPFANGHEDWMNAATRLGNVIGSAVEGDNLYLDIEFPDEASRDIALRADVSVGLLDKFEDGRGKMHRTVIRHLAATNAPVIPALEEWAAIAASFNSAKSTVMSTILEHLGVETEELALSAIKELQTKAADKTEKVELSHSPLLVRTVRDARELQLSALVSAGEISPAVKAEVIKYYGSDKRVALDLSQNSDGSDWDAVLSIAKLASKSKPVATHGRSNAPSDNEVELSHNGQGSTYLQRVEKWAETQKDRFAGRNGSHN